MPSEPFTDLASVYDAIMSDIEYDDWIAFVLRTVIERGWKGGRILDLGCGTGNSTSPIFSRGFEVQGVDASAAMLAVAREKLPQVRLFQADFETFELPDRFTLVYSVFDSLNNLLAPDAFSTMAARVARHLEPGGMFMFDINTTVGLRELCEGGCVEGWAGDVHYRWNHSFDDASGFATVEAFCEKGGHSFVEVHFERPYDLAEVRELLLATDFSRVEALTYPTGECASEDAARIWVVSTKA